MEISTLKSGNSVKATTVIEPLEGWVAVNLGELWRYRDLLFFLAQRDIAVRYKQTILGALWAIIQPVVTMIIFSIFFGNLAKIPSDGIPYPVFSYAALLPWQYFAAALANASDSLVGNANLLSKVYFPRLIIPLAAVLPPLVDFIIAFGVLILIMLYFGIAPTWHVLWLAVFMLLAVITALGSALWLSALNVQYRDVRYAVPFLIQAWLFLSPVVYSSSIVPVSVRSLYGLNPMAGVIEGFRWALLGTSTPPGLLTVVSALVSFAILVGGLLFFRRMERTFADVV